MLQLDHGRRPDAGIARVRHQHGVLGQRLTQLVLGAPSREARDLSRRVLGAVEEFSTGAGQADDITLMVIGYRDPDLG